MHARTHSTFDLFTHCVDCRAQISDGTTTHSLGDYLCAEDAAVAFDVASISRSANAARGDIKGGKGGSYGQVPFTNFPLTNYAAAIPDLLGAWL